MPARASLVPALLAAVAVSSCGGVSDTAAVRKVVTRFGQASAKKDYQQICDDLISRELVETVESVGLPCEIAFKKGLGPVQQPILLIRSVKVKKGVALVTVHTSAANQKASDDTLQLVRESGGWRIARIVATPRP